MKNIETKLKRINISCIILFVLLIFNVAISISTMNAVKNSISNEANTVSLAEFNKMETSLNNKIDNLSMTIEKLSTPEVIEVKEPEIQTVVQEKIPEESKAINTTDISKPSNMSVNEINSLITEVLADKNKTQSELSGLGEALYDMEQDYGINAIFAISVASLESSWGTSDAVVYRNNLFGIYSGSSPKTFNDLDECIDYFGDLIRNRYIDRGLSTVESISDVYCTSPGWDTSINKIMSTYTQYIN